MEKLIAHCIQKGSKVISRKIIQTEALTRVSFILFDWRWLNAMSQGLKKHWCQYYEDYSYTRYDADRKCDKKVVVYRCMICGHEHTEVYYMQHKEPKCKANSTLERNKNKYHG